MKRETVIGFILGALLGTGVTYVVMQGEVRKAVAEATEKLGKQVRTMGSEVEKAGRQMKAPENKR
ncbi:MAG: hypothetical protein AAFN74_18945 [Myxococcota bacterium]